MLFGRKQKKPITLPDKKVVAWKTSTCGYCSTGCSIEIGLDAEGKAISARGLAAADVNQGKLCLKGIFKYELFQSPGRGDRPLIRKNPLDPFQETGWDQALDKTAAEIKRIQACYGRDAFAILSTGQILTEEFYTLGKLVRGVIGTNHYDGNTTLCMASAVSGHKRSFGADGPPGCYDDFNHTDGLIAFGSNLPEQHPLIYWRLQTAKTQRQFPLIVVDPRVTQFAQQADIHLAITPGTDLVLLNSLAYVILAEGLEDRAYIKAHTRHYQEFADLVQAYDPDMAAKICGIDAGTIRTVARLYGQANAAMSIWTMGINQSIHGSDGVVGINNLNLITGNLGKPGGTSLSITGQCNAMGTREWSSCAGLPGYRLLENPEHRQEIADFWGIDADFFPKKRGLVQTDIFPAIETGQIKGLWLVATNPLSSMPDTARVRKALEKLEFLVVQDAYHDMESNSYSHVYLPAALWAEKEGVMTNTERRVNKVNPTIPPFGQSKPDLWIFNRMAERFAQGKKINFPESPAQVFEELRQLSHTPQQQSLLDYSGLSYEMIEQQCGVQWPCPKGAKKGEARLYTTGQFQHRDGRAKLIPLPFADNNERPDEQYPFWLNTGRVVEHFHTRTRTGKVGNLNKFSPIPYMEINPEAAQRLGIAHGSYAQLSSRRGNALVLAQHTHRVALDTIFTPFHFYESVNRLSLGLLDPHSRQPAFKQCAVAIEPVTDQEAAAQRNLQSRGY